jgi:Icc-related predicted phosphoesterase
LKAWIISDLHIMQRELHSVPFPIPDADICICAGDVAGFIEMSIQFLLSHIEPHMPVISVLGNHDYYSGSIASALATAKRAAGDSNLQVLENETAIFEGVRIIGATLWTDFAIPHGGPGPELPLQARRSLAVQVARRYMLDFRAIYGSLDVGQTDLITPEEWLARHTESREFITDELAQPFDGKTVVVTHHAPLPRSLHPDFAGDPSNGAFASDLTDLIRRADVWVHGHVHHGLDYIEHDTRVICNPRGYPREYAGCRFRPGLVIDL